MLLPAFSRHSNALLGDQKLPSDTSRVPLYAVCHLQTSLSTTAQSLLYPAGHLCARRHSPILAVHTAERRQLFPHRIVSSSGFWHPFCHWLWWCVLSAYA